MNKIIFKFALSLALLLNTVIIVFFFSELIETLEPFLFPLFFIYFIFDSFTVIFPFINNDIYSAKMTKRMYIPIENYDKEELMLKYKQDNKRALVIFVSYVAFIGIIGISYLHFSWFTTKYIYLIFFAINFADYFCIMLWCPFRNIFLKNTCCNTCRISNWDRLMKVSILLFIPNIFTISINVLALMIFVYWEYQHKVHKERFYRISNKRLWCNNCDKETCGKSHR